MAERSKNAKLSQPGQAIDSAIDLGVQSDTLTGPNQGSWKTSSSTRQQEVEDQYGGIIGEGYGVYRAISDAIRNTSINPVKRKYPTLTRKVNGRTQRYIKTSRGGRWVNVK